uniref:Heat shock protein 67B2 n=1 Tax=Lepeophtheirus salmonis TaxID=72036 RepID=C1BSF4_LEPSM|nr:Heat shock protein 67B2 [Lepeophtheirus salmonis]
MSKSIQKLYFLCAIVLFALKLDSALGETLGANEFLSSVNQVGIDQVILDCRSEFEREVQGYLEGSHWFDNCQIKDDVVPSHDLKGKSTDLILCIRGKRSTKADATKLIQALELKSSKLDDFEGDLRELGKELKVTRFVHFDALSALLNEKKILLIDVRNRTELNEVGQIRGSVCLPLHEIPLAFTKLNENDFQERYGFSKPNPLDSSNIVLTCRSGRRVLVADKKMKPLGFENLRIYSGSFNEWSQMNGDSFKADFNLDYDILEE